MSSSVQFFGIDNVLQAYRNCDIPAFALWTGKTLLLKYDGYSNGEYTKPTIDEGEQLLNEYLNAMYQQSTAIYQLKVYEDLTAKTKIKPSTEYSQAFNFKIGDAAQGYNTIGYSQKNNAYSELQELKNKVAELENERIEPEPQEEKKSFIHSITGGMFDDTDELEKVVGLVTRLFRPQQPVKTQTFAGVGQHTVTENRVSDISSESGNTEEQRINTALSALQKADTMIIEHLELLARIATNEPAQFKQFLAILDTLK